MKPPGGGSPSRGSTLRRAGVLRRSKQFRWLSGSSGWKGRSFYSPCYRFNEWQYLNGAGQAASFLRFSARISWSHFGQYLCSPSIYPCCGQIENVGVIVMYGWLKRSSERRTSDLHASALVMRSLMYRCSTVPPVYLRCNCSCRSSASNGSSVKPTGSCEELV